MNLLDSKSLLILSDSQIVESFFIPEPTRSLLLFTNGDPSKARSSLSITINVSLNQNGVKAEIEDNHNLLAEPSLICDLAHN